MPSQEEYLDQLLREVLVETERVEKEAEPETGAVPFETDLSAADVSFERANAQADTGAPFSVDNMTLDEVLSGTEVGSGIQEKLLTETENNEDVLEELLSGTEIGDALFEDAFTGAEDDSEIGEDILSGAIEKDENGIPGEWFAEEKAGGEEAEETLGEDAESEQGAFLSEKILDFSEEDINRVLQEQQNGTTEDFSVMEDADLMQLLDGMEDEDSNDIQEMLQKSDKNEAVDAELISELQNVPDVVGDREAREKEEIEGADEMTPAQRRAAEKKRLREEKAAAKKAAKEAKKAEKAAKKAEKAAGKAKKTSQKESDLSETDASEDSMMQEMADMDSLLLFGGDDGEEAPDAGGGEDASYGGTEEDPDFMSFAEGGEEEAVSLLSGVNGQDEGTLYVGGMDDEMAVDLSDLDAEIPERIKEKGGKKKNLFARIADFLTEEDEEESFGRGNEDIQISDENQNILEELDKEGKGKKSKKAKKGKKGQKGQTEQSQNADENAAEGEIEEKKAPKKEKKPKKVKAPKRVPESNDGLGLPLSKVMPIVVLGMTIVMVVVLATNLGGDYTVKREARTAFYQEDYETCYQNLYGKNLSETELVMFGKSESILRIRLWLREYEIYVNEGAEPEALEILIQSVRDYDALYAYASQWNANSDVAETYREIVRILSEKYHMTEEQARFVAAVPDDYEYTRMIHAILQGNVPNAGSGTGMSTEALPDMLPEEQGFAENQILLQDTQNAGVLP